MPPVADDFREALTRLRGRFSGRCRDRRALAYWPSPASMAPDLAAKSARSRLTKEVKPVYRMCYGINARIGWGENPLNRSAT